MLITNRKAHYKGLVTIRLSKLRELAEKHGKIFVCDCGCEFFREDTKHLNMVRCNSCKVWHRLEFHDERLEGILQAMDKRFRKRIFTTRPEEPLNTIQQMERSRRL